jgi:hypothetical protein
MKKSMTKFINCESGSARSRSAGHYALVVSGDWMPAFPISGLDCGLPPDFRKITLARLLELKVGRSYSYELFADELIVMTGLTWPSEDQTFVRDNLRSVIERLVIYPVANLGCLECKYRMRTGHGFRSKDPVEIRLTAFGKDL